MQSEDRHFEIIWHSGEPMAVGIEKFKILLDAFNGLKVTHSIQTNATLINNDWCALFKEYKIKVGVSLDGDATLNKNRVNWQGVDSYRLAYQGIRHLIANDIPFSVISVIQQEHLSKAQEIYNYFIELGCFSWGLNIEEQEAANHSAQYLNDEAIIKFWQELFICWKDNPKIRIREIDYALTWMDKICENPDFSIINRDIELFPSIGWNGDLVLLSPEFLNTQTIGDNFVVGNVTQKSIKDLLSNVNSYLYVEEFSKGILKCSRECPYFSFCGGGYASNKYYENGTLNSTLTKHCTRSKINLVNSIFNTFAHEYDYSIRN